MNESEVQKIRKGESFFSEVRFSPQVLTVRSTQDSIRVNLIKCRRCRLFLAMYIGHGLADEHGVFFKIHLNLACAVYCNVTYVRRRAVRILKFK